MKFIKVKEICSVNGTSISIINSANIHEIYRRSDGAVISFISDKHDMYVRDTIDELFEMLNK